MFLNILSKKEKLDFAKLLHAIAEIDGDFSKQEEDQISVYLNEMGLKKSDVNLDSLNLDSLIDTFSSSNDTVKKSIFMELIALVFADGEFSQEEKIAIDKIKTEFTLSDQYIKEVVEWVNTITPLYHQGFQLAGLINGGK